VLASIRREEDEHTVMLRSLGLLYSSGYAIDWNRIYPERGVAKVALPSYPWQRQRCWLEPNADANYQSEHAGNPGAGNSLLGRHFKSAGSGADYWEIRLDKESLPFLDDHKIEGVAALPASLYVEMASAAAYEASGSRAIALTDVEFHRALFMPDGTSPTIQVMVAPAGDGAASFQIYSLFKEAKSWTLHASGKVAAQQNSASLHLTKEDALRKSSFEAPKKSQAKTTIDSLARTRSSMDLLSRASFSYGSMVRASWANCGFRMVTSIPGSFIQRSSMAAYRYSEQR